MEELDYKFIRACTTVLEANTLLGIKKARYQSRGRALAEKRCPEDAAFSKL